MFIIELLIVLLAIYLGARLKGIALDFAGGIGVLILVLIFKLPAVFILPTYPTVLAAIEMDQTGSTRIGRYIFNHPFIIPGITTIIFSVLLAYGFGLVIL